MKIITILLFITCLSAAVINVPDDPPAIQAGIDVSAFRGCDCVDMDLSGNINTLDFTIMADTILNGD